MICEIAAVVDEWENPPHMSDGDAIRKRRKALGWTQQDLATRSKLNIETVVRIERDAVVKVTTLRAVKDALAEGERDPSRHGGTGQQGSPEVEDFDRDIGRGYKRNDVPVVGDAEASSDGLLSWDAEGVVSAQIEQWVSRSFADGDPRAYALRIRGDSMVPRYFPGEIIVVQPRVPVRDGDFACVTLTNGERLVKRVFKQDGGWLLRSLNSSYPDRTVAASDIAAMHRIKHSITT